jgi:hypothetical protein
MLETAGNRGGVREKAGANTGPLAEKTVTRFIEKSKGGGIDARFFSPSCGIGRPELRRSLDRGGQFGTNAR